MFINGACVKCTICTLLKFPKGLPFKYQLFDIFWVKGARTGITLEGGEIISSEIVVSNADPRTTHFDLIGKKNL